MDKIKDNLDHTTRTMHNSLIKISQRGIQINDISETSQILLNSSDDFVMRVVPWYTRLWISLRACWWFQCREQEAEPLRRSWVAI